MKRLLYIFLVASSSFLLSCSSTTNTMHLRPIADESAYFDGKEVVKAEKDSIKIVASYDGRYDKYMVFDIEIFNNTDKPLTISPKNFSFMPLDMDKNPIYRSDSTFIYQAVEPQEQLQKTEYAIQKQHTQLKTAKVVNTALFIGGIVAILSATTDKRSESAWRTANIGETMIQAASIKRVIDHENYYTNLDKIHREQGVWMNERFKTTTLSPHSSLRGGVFMHAIPKASFIQLSYPTMNDSITFLFQQSFEKR